MISNASWVDAIQTVAAAAAFIFILYQIHHLRRAMLAGAHDRLEAHYVDVLRIIVEKPYLRPYFYESAPYERSSDPDGTLRAEIDTVSECFLGLIEHASLQRRNLLDDTWESCWLPYARERLRKSPEMRTFLLQNRDWYTEGMHELLSGVDQARSVPGTEGETKGKA